MPASIATSSDSSRVFIAVNLPSSDVTPEIGALTFQQAL
jgi:hypothetical protein